MKLSLYSPSNASMICSSVPVPSVVTTKACVSPRVNKAEPCARGRIPTSATIGRTSTVLRPSIRPPVLRMPPRTTSASADLNFAVTTSAPMPASSLVNFSTAWSRSALTFAWRSSLICSLYASVKGAANSALRSSPSFLIAGSSSVISHGSFAHISARSIIVSITGWKPFQPNITASSMMSSESCSASDSTINTPSCVPATTRSRSLSAICSIVGLRMNSPSL